MVDNGIQMAYINHVHEWYGENLMENIGSIKNPDNDKLYRFHRICRLEECEIDFYTNRKDHFFCSTEHQQEYWKRIRHGERSLQSEIFKQRNEIEKIKKQLGMNND